MHQAGRRTKHEVKKIEKAGCAQGWPAPWVACLHSYLDRRRPSARFSVPSLRRRSSCLPSSHQHFTSHLQKLLITSKCHKPALPPSSLPTAPSPTHPLHLPAPPPLFSYFSSKRL